MKDVENLIKSFEPNDEPRSCKILMLEGQPESSISALLWLDKQDFKSEALTFTIGSNFKGLSDGYFNGAKYIEVDSQIEKVIPYSLLKEYEAKLIDDVDLVGPSSYSVSFVNLY